MVKAQSLGIVRRLWMLLAAIGLVVTFAGSANAVESAQVSGGLHIAHLCAQTTEDSGTDEIYVKKNGTTVWGPRSINEGTCAPSIFVNVARGNVITLYDQDGGGWDSDDWLGTVTINDVGEYHFTGDGAFYKMWTEN